MGLRKLFTSLCAFLSSVAVADSLRLEELDIHDISSYSTLTETAQRPIQNYFVELDAKGLIKGFYLTPETFGGLLASMLVTQLTDLRNGVCSAVFCADPGMRDKVRAESAKGRAVLLTHSYSDLHGAVLSDDFQDVAEFKSHFRPGNPQLSLLILAPSATQDYLAHELFHAADFESGALKELQVFARALADAKKMSVQNAIMVVRFVTEIRAYDQQRLFLEAATRETEFEYKKVDEYSGEPVPVNGPEFRHRRAYDIEFKIKRIYLNRMLTALHDQLLPTAEHDALIRLIERLMPQSGPYTYEKLMKMQIAQLGG